MWGNNQNKSSQGEETCAGAHHRFPRSQRGICHLPSWEANVVKCFVFIFFVCLLVCFVLFFLLRLTLYSRRIHSIDMTVKSLGQKLQPSISVSVDASLVFD